MVAFAVSLRRDQNRSAPAMFWPDAIYVDPALPVRSWWPDRHEEGFKNANARH